MKKIFFIFLLGAFSCFVGMHFLQITFCQTFPHFNEKYKSEAILTPQQFMGFLKEKGAYSNFNAPKTLIMCVDRSLFENILQKYKTQKCGAWASDLYLLTDYPSVAVTKLGMTSSLAVMAFEMAIAWGIKQAIFIGTTCALQKDIAVGDLMVCEKAIRDEGTSHHYLPYGKYAYPSKKMQTKFLEILKDMNKPYKLGTILTTSAFFQMKVDEARHYQKEGVLGVEMEMAGLLSVAVYRHIDMIAFGTRTDTYANLVWEKSANYKDAKMKALNEFFEIALKVAVQE